MIKSKDRLRQRHGSPTNNLKELIDHTLGLSRSLNCTILQQELNAGTVDTDKNVAVYLISWLILCTILAFIER